LIHINAVASCRQDGDADSRKERAMHRVLPAALFAVAALGIAACQDTQTGAATQSSEASAAALNYDLPDNTVPEGEKE